MQYYPRLVTDVTLMHHAVEVLKADRNRTWVVPPHLRLTGPYHPKMYSTSAMSGLLVRWLMLVRGSISV